MRRTDGSERRYPHSNQKMSDTNTVSVSGKFDLKTVAMIVAIIFGITGISIGGFTVSGINQIPTAASVDSSTVKIVDAIGRLSYRVQVYEGELRRFSSSVNENQDAIQEIRESQLKSDSLQIQRFKVLWEESRLNRQVLGELSAKVDTLKNPFDFLTKIK